MGKYSLQMNGNAIVSAIVIHSTVANVITQNYGDVLQQ